MKLRRPLRSVAVNQGESLSRRKSLRGKPQKWSHDSGPDHNSNRIRNRVLSRKWKRKQIPSTIDAKPPFPLWKKRRPAAVIGFDPGNVAMSKPPNWSRSNWNQLPKPARLSRQKRMKDLRPSRFRHLRQHHRKSLPLPMPSQNCHAADPASVPDRRIRLPKRLRNWLKQLKSLHLLPLKFLASLFGNWTQVLGQNQSMMKKRKRAFLLRQVIRVSRKKAKNRVNLRLQW